MDIKLIEENIDSKYTKDIDIFAKIKQILITVILIESSIFERSN